MDPNTDDLRLLEAVKRAKPTMLEGAGNYVLKGSIPRDVLAAVEALPISMEYTKVDRLWCMSFMDWLFCRDRLIAELMTRMTSRSHGLGLVGPVPEDLEHAPTLSHWIAVHDLQCGGVILLGRQTGHPELKGCLINTSRICGIDPGQRWARTATRWYRLNGPATAANLVEQLGGTVAALKHLMLEFTQVQDVVAKDQMDTRFSDV